MKNRLTARHFTKIALSAVLLIVAVVFALSYVSKDSELSASRKFDQSSFENEVSELVGQYRTSGVEASFAYARLRLNEEPAFARDCHRLMHRLAHESFPGYANFQDAMAESDELCNSGYVHGLIEANFQNASSVDEALQLSCPEDGVENFAKWQCYHGIGHGAMNVEGKDSAKSVEYCKKLKTLFAIESCINGVYMEKFIFVSHNGKHEADPAGISISLCKGVPTAEKVDCYFYAPTSFLEVNTSRYAQAVKFCEQAEASYILTCVSGVGSQAMKDNVTNPAFASRFCKSLDQTYQETCVSGAVSLYANHHASSSQTKSLCDNEFRKFTQTCLRVVEKKRANLKI